MSRWTVVSAIMAGAAAAGPATPAAAAETPRSRPATADDASGNWTLTVYYNAVESHYGGARQSVRGCPVLDCVHGQDPLGSYPADFLDAVRREGSGRITSGIHAGKFLNHSPAVGYWLDRAARDAQDNPLVPFRSAAADGDVLPPGARFTATGCGTDSGGPVDPTVCDAIRASTWQVSDTFAHGGGPRHIDLYIGDQPAPDVETSPWNVELTGATVRPAGL